MPEVPATQDAARLGLNAKTLEAPTHKTLNPQSEGSLGDLVIALEAVPLLVRGGLRVARGCNPAVWGAFSWK